jgi:hypothetical protein
VPAEQQTGEYPKEQRFKSLVVSVYTPDEEDGGTDSDVKLEIGGQTFDLDNDENNFERGNTDTFVLDMSSTMGELRETTIRLKCPGGGWYCGWVAISVVMEGETLARRYKQFDVTGWLHAPNTSRQLQP